MQVMSMIRSLKEYDDQPRNSSREYLVLGWCGV